MNQSYVCIGGPQDGRRLNIPDHWRCQVCVAVPPERLPLITRLDDPIQTWTTFRYEVREVVITGEDGSALRVAALVPAARMSAEMLRRVAMYGDVVT